MVKGEPPEQDSPSAKNLSHRSGEGEPRCLCVPDWGGQDLLILFEYIFVVVVKLVLCCAR